MKTEKMVLCKFGLTYGEASKIVKQARQNLGLKASVTWTEDLEKEAFRIAQGEGSESTATTASSTPAPQKPIPGGGARPVTIIQSKGENPDNDNLGCWTPEGLKGKVPAGSKIVAALQHDTLLEGAEQQEGAPKPPVRKTSNLHDSDDSNVISGDDSMPMPFIRPLRRTDGRTKHG